MSAAARRIRNVATALAAGEDVKTDTRMKTESARQMLRENGPAALVAAIKAGMIPDEATAADGTKVSDVLPGPLQAHSREELLVEIAKAEEAGENHTQWMEWQEEYGDQGLNSNIVVPCLDRSRAGGMRLTEKVLLSDPDDCLRIARAHTQKQPNFQLFMGDSIISATDNDVWKPQRDNITEAFMPTSSLAHIFPISVDRAEQCAEILKRLSQGGTQKVNMTEFFLNETQQQLHLALFGETEEKYDEEYNAVFRDAMGGPPGDDIHQFRHAQYGKQKQAEAATGRVYQGGAFEALAQEGVMPRTDETVTQPVKFLRDLNEFIRKGKDEGKFAAPSDVQADPSKKIHGPLSAVLSSQMDNVHSEETMGAKYGMLPDQTKMMLNESANMGNAFIFAFAGHDTTGHTLTWLTYELAKNPYLQQRLVDEVDSFWEECSGRELEFMDMQKLPFLTRCVTETLRLWPVVPNGTFRQLSFDDKVKGPGGKMVSLPKGTLVQVTTIGRHRSKENWGDDADVFNPDREFRDDELWHDQVYAARNPHSRRFSPFTHAPRDCVGKNFAQMEIRTILTQLFKNFTFELTDNEKEVASKVGTSPARGKNAGTMGPMDVDFEMPHKPYGMHVYAKPRNADAADWQKPINWPKSRGVVPEQAIAK